MNGKSDARSSRISEWAQTVDWCHDDTSLEERGAEVVGKCCLRVVRGKGTTFACCACVDERSSGPASEEIKLVPNLD
jgi:hypothetical protein